MDINDIRKRRALINRQISKGFNDNFSQENISKAYDDEFNKAHKVGDIHPNGKWVWTEIKPGKFDWRVIKKSKGSTVGYKVSSAATDRAAAAKKLVDKIKADQAAKTPMQKSIDKQLVDAGFSATGQNSKGGTIYRITDNTNLPNEFGQGWLPEVTMYNNGSIDVDIYESNSISKLNYTDKVASFSYGKLTFKSNNPNVIDLAKKLTSLIDDSDQDNYEFKYNEQTESFDVNIDKSSIYSMGNVRVLPKGNALKYVSFMRNPFGIVGKTLNFDTFGDLKKFLNHYSSIYAECKNAQKEVEVEKKRLAKKQADMDAKRQEFQNFLRQQ